MTIQLYHGDCLDVMKTLTPNSIDLVLTDPPYGTTQCKWDSVIPFDKMWECLNALTKKTVVLFGAEPFSSALRMSNVKKYKYDWVWEKPQSGFLNAKKMPLKNVECISVFQNTLWYNPQFVKGTPYICHRKNKKSPPTYGKQRDHSTFSNGDRYPMQILKYGHDKERFHPTQKPVALLEYLIKTYTNKGDTVLDFTMGSGSTAIACLNTGRNFIGIERDDKYFRIAKERIEKHQNIFDTPLE